MEPILNLTEKYIENNKFGLNIYKSKEINYCMRCKIKQADFKCPCCSPFNYFCASCDGYVHSMNTKRNHNREIIEKSQKVFECINPHDNLKLQYNNSNSSNIEFNQNIKYDSLSNNRNFKENYLNEIKSIYEGEREDLTNKIFTLEKQLDFIKSGSNERIANLQNELNENIKNYNLKLQMIEEKNEIIIRKILSEKENEIRILQNKNGELEKSNSELICKINEYQNDFYQMKNNYEKQLTSLELDFLQQKNELSDSKNYYEKKINLINDNFMEDKSKIINNYEKNIEKINFGYKESKEKYLDLLGKRDNDYNNLLSKMKKEEK